MRMRCETHLLTITEIDPEKFVSRFFEIECRHDREIDGTLKVDLVRSSLIVYIDCTVSLCVRQSSKLSVTFLSEFSEFGTH